MSRSYTRQLSSVAGLTELEQIRAKTLADTLGRIMREKGWSQSDLAREVWGERKDNDGRTSAMGRDKISRYMRGLQLPDPGTLKEIADAIGMTPEELAPDTAVEVAERTTSTMTLTQPEGRPDLIRLQLNLLLPADLALKVAQLVNEGQNPKASKAGGG